MTDSISIDNEVQEIRRLKVKGYSDSKIMQELGIPRATFYRYKARMREQMKDVMKTHDKAAVMEDIQLCKDRLENLLFRVQAKLENEDISVKQLNDLTERAQELSLNVAKLQYDAEKFLSTVESDKQDGKDSEHNRRDSGEQAAEKPADSSTSQ